MYPRTRSQRAPWAPLVGLAGGLAYVCITDADRASRRRQALERETIAGAVKRTRERSLLDEARDGVRRDLLSMREEHWSPRTRFVLGALGTALTALGLRRTGVLGVGLGGLGLSLVARSVTNFPLTRVVGVHRARIAISKTCEIAAPIDVVYRYWDVEQFPRIMDRVEEVRREGEDRYHWKMAGPAGVPLEWDAVVTRRDPNRLVVWTTEPGSLVSHVGMVRFEPMSANMTRLSVHLSYDPPAGCLGHAVARLFGVDPRSELDRDLSRFRQVVESTPWLLRARDRV